MLLECFGWNFPPTWFRKYLWRKSYKGIFSIYHQWIATVHMFLKVPTTGSLVYFLEYILRAAILTEASVSTCK